MYPSCTCFSQPYPLQIPPANNLLPTLNIAPTNIGFCSPVDYSLEPPSQASLDFLAHLKLNPAIAYFKGQIKIILYTEVLSIANIWITMKTFLGTNVCMLYKRNYVKSGCTIAGFHCTCFRVLRTHGREGKCRISMYRKFCIPWATRFCLFPCCGFCCFSGSDWIVNFDVWNDLGGRDGRTAEWLDWQTDRWADGRKNGWTRRLRDASTYLWQRSIYLHPSICYTTLCHQARKLLFIVVENVMAPIPSSNILKLLCMTYGPRDHRKK